MLRLGLHLAALALCAGVSVAAVGGLWLEPREPSMNSGTDSLAPLFLFVFVGFYLVLLALTVAFTALSWRWPNAPLTICIVILVLTTVPFMWFAGVDPDWTSSSGGVPGLVIILASWGALASAIAGLVAVRRVAPAPSI